MGRPTMAQANIYSMEAKLHANISFSCSVLYQVST
jgi:hypothetical protein